MAKRVEIDIIVSSYLEEMRKDHDVKTIKEMVEKCILFCYLNKVNFDNKNVKSLYLVVIEEVIIPNPIEIIAINTIISGNVKIYMLGLTCDPL